MMAASAASSSMRRVAHARAARPTMSRSCTVCAGGAVADELVHDAEPAADRDRRRRARGSSPRMMRSSVVLPAPFAPISAVVDPSPTRNDDLVEQRSAVGQHVRDAVDVDVAHGDPALRSVSAARPRQPTSRSPPVPRDGEPTDCAAAQAAEYRPTRSRGRGPSPPPPRGSSAARSRRGPASRCPVMWAISCTARSKASWFAFDGFVVPAILRTYCRAAAWTSSVVAAGSKLWRVWMFRHMPSTIRRAAGQPGSTRSPGLVAARRDVEDVRQLGREARAEQLGDAAGPSRSRRPGACRS